MATDRKELILDATIALLKDHRDVDIATVANEAHVSLGLAYRYFDDIDDLVDQAWAKIFEGLIQQDAKEFEKFLKANSDQEILLGVFSFFEEIFSKKRDEIRWQRVAAIIANRRTGKATQAINDTREAIINTYATVLGQAGVFDDFENEQDKRAAVVVITGLAMGTTLMMRDAETPAMRQAISRAAVEAILGVLMRPSRTN